MESSRRSTKHTFSLPTRSKAPRDLSEQPANSLPEAAKNLDRNSTAEKSPKASKSSRRGSVRQAFRQHLSRLHTRRLPPPQQRSKQPPKDPSASFPERIMDIIEQQIARTQGGPVRGPQGVIDLTSDNDEEDDFFEDIQKPPDERDDIRIKRERLELRNELRQELVEQMGDHPAFGQAQQPPNPPAVPDIPYGRVPDVWGDYDLAEDFEDEMIAGVFDFDQHYPAARAPESQPAAEPPPPVPAIQAPIPEDIMEPRVDCVHTVVTVFPGICRDYVSELYDTFSKSSERLIAHILDKMDKGSSYPNAKEKQKQLKRKREVDEDAEAARKYGALDRIMPTNVGGIRSFIARILSFEFPFTAMNFIHATLSRSGYRLYSAYEVLEEAQRTWIDKKPYPRLKNARKSEDFTEQKVADFLASPAVNGYIDREKVEVFEELQAARRVRQKADARRAVERAAEIEEEENLARAEAEGTMSECQCCCCDYPINRMVHCDGDTLHWFCRGCAKRTAEVEIGKSKYELHCMSTDKCCGGFALDQRLQFLDENTRVALERNEQEANLRMAGIENLESCPFCPFAAEYPPVEQDREFRCQAPECERVSCRLCRLESHIPKSCEENAKDSGLSIRRQIEEAMSAAMIRKCNKCGTPFVKEEGCNKMTCTRNGCRNIQCYVCSKSCDYSHFNDPSRGGKAGNCPLFESVQQRHDEEVKRAEREALQKVLSDHPEYSEEDLKIKMSENVTKDDEKRKATDPHARLEAMRAAVGRPGLRAVNFMQIRPMMPHPPTLVRRPHDLPDFPQLLCHPDQLDPYNEIGLGYYDDAMMEDYQYRPARRGVWPMRNLRPRPLARNVPAGLRNINGQAMLAPVANGPAAAENNDPLDDFYRRWREEVLQRQAAPSPPPRPQNPAPQPPNNAAVEPGNGNLHVFQRPRANANVNLQPVRQPSVPILMMNPPLGRPNFERPPEPAKAPRANDLQAAKLQNPPRDRPENAVEIREKQEPHALQGLINDIREFRAGKARQAAIAENARAVAGLQQIQRNFQMARVEAPLHLDPMEGVQNHPYNRPANQDQLPPAADPYQAPHNKLERLKTVLPARIPEQLNAVENNRRQNRGLAGFDLFPPVPAAQHDPAGFVPGVRMEGVYQQLNKVEEQLRQLGQQGNVDVARPPPAPLNESRPDIYRLADSRVAQDNIPARMIPNPAGLAHPYPNFPVENVNLYPNPANQPGFHNYYPQPRPMQQPQMLRQYAIPQLAFQMPVDVQNLRIGNQIPPAPRQELSRHLEQVEDQAREYQVVARAELQAQNHQQALLEIRLVEAQVAQARARVAAAQVQAEAVQAEIANIAAGVVHPPPGPLLAARFQHEADAEIQQYRMLYGPGADINAQRMDRPGFGANAVLEANGNMPGNPRDRMFMYLDRMRGNERGRGHNGGAMAPDPVYQPEEVVEEYESDDGVVAGVGNGQKKA